MNIEELIPKKESAEILGISLKEIFDKIKGLSLKQLLDSPREFVLKGRIDIDLLRQIRKLGVEFSISGEKNRLVFGTGTEETVDPFPNLYEDPNYPSPAKRYMKATYSMHSHPSQNGIFPSLGDLQAMTQSKNTSSIIFTEKGILRYTWRKDFNAREKFKNFVLLKHPEFVSNQHKINELSKEEMIGLLRDFVFIFDAVLDDVPWDNKEGCQRVIDNYLDQLQA